MTRLRIGHSNLNGTLNMIGRHQNGLCDHCQEAETVQHVLVYCRKYIVQRKDMLEGMEKAGLKSVDIKGILECGESGQGREYLISFLLRTGLIKRI